MKKKLTGLLALLASCTLMSACFVGTAGSSTSSNSAPASSEGTTSEGTTSEGTSEGTTSEGTTSEGTTSEGTTSEGTTSEGTSEGTTSEDNTSEDNTTSEEEDPHAEAMELAKDYIYGQLIEKDVTVKADYTLLSTYYSFFLEGDVAISWTVDVEEGVTVTYNEDTKVWDVDVDEFLTEDLVYTLTATLTDPEGCHTATFTLDRKVSKADEVVPEKLTKAPVEGEAYKLYMYQAQKKNDLYFTGKIASDFYLGTNNASKGEGYEVSVDVFVEKVEGKDAYYLTFTYDGVKKYIGITNVWNDGSYHNNNIIATSTEVKEGEVKTFEFVWNEEYGTLIATLEGVKSGKVEDTTESTTESFFLGTKGGYYTFDACYVSNITDDTYYVGYLVKMVNKSTVADEDKVATEKDTLSITDSFSGAVKENLPTQGTVYGDVSITWAVKEGPADVTNNVLTVEAPSADTTIVLTATLTLGDVSVTKDVTINVYPKSVVTEVAEPEEGTAYAFYLYQAKKAKTYYFTGVMDGNFLAMTDDASKAADVYVEASGSGYKIYVLDAEKAKSYITLTEYESDGKYKAKVSLSEEGSVFTRNAQFGMWTCNTGNNHFYLGTYNDFTTISASATSFVTVENAGVTQYIAKFGIIDESAIPEQPDQPDQPEQPEQPDEPVVNGVVPVEGKAYIFGMTQGNLENAVYYLAGGMDSYYMATTTDAEAAIKTYIEATEGGYYFYTYVNDVKTYINMVVSGTHVNGAYEAAPSTVYTFDEKSMTLIAIVNEAEYWFGTRNDKTYTTMGPCAVSYAGFYGVFYDASEEGGETPDEPVVPDEPITPPVVELTTMPIATILASPVGEQYQAEGTVVAVNAKSFVLMDERTGTKTRILVYLNSAPGVEIGDIVKVVGKTAEYANGVQFAAGTTVEKVGTGGATGAFIAMTQTAADLDALAAAEKVSVSTYIHVQGTLTIDGKYYNVTIEGATTAIGSITYPDETLAAQLAEYDGQLIDIHGYITGVTSGKYIQIVAVEVMAVENTTPDEKPEEKPEEKPYNVADFETFDTLETNTNNGANSKYQTYTTENGWTTEYAAVNAGGTVDSNPIFTVFGKDNSTKAVTLLGRTTQVGALYSPELTGGITALYFNYTKLFSDTILSVTITIYDLENKEAEPLTYVLTKDATNEEKYTVWDFEWKLETAIKGAFAIDIVNNCPSQLDSNKDRISIWNITWDMFEGEEKPEEECKHFYVDGVCENCGEADPDYKPEEEACKHFYVDGVCENCGEADPDYKPEVEECKHFYVDGVCENCGEADPDYVAPVVPATLTISEALALGATYGHNTYTTDKYYVTGKIESIANTTFGNIYLTDGTNSILVYGLYIDVADSDTDIRYDAMEKKPLVGDTITVLSVVGNYSSAAQLKNAFLVELTDATAAEKVAVEKDALTFIDAAFGAKEVELPTAGSLRPDVAISWEITEGSNIASIVDGKLVISNPETETTVKVVAILTVNETDADDSKEFVIVVTPATGDLKEYSESFAIAASKGTLNGKAISWSSEHFNFLGEQAASTSAIRTSDSDHYRVYKSSTFKVSAKAGEQITKLVITGYGETKYITPIAESLTTSGATVETNGKVITISFASAVSAVEFAATAQFRVASFEITYLA